MQNSELVSEYTLKSLISTQILQILSLHRSWEKLEDDQRHFRRRLSFVQRITGSTEEGKGVMSRLDVCPV